MTEDHQGVAFSYVAGVKNDPIGRTDIYTSPHW